MTRSLCSRALGRSRSIARSVVPSTLAVVACLGVPAVATPLTPDDDSASSSPAADLGPSVPQVVLADLRPRTQDPAVALELAAFLASRGDAETARDTLRGVEFGDGDGALRDRVSQELVRVEDWIATRDRFLQQLAADGRKMVVEDGDKRRRLEIERVEGGRVHFAENRWDIESVPVTSLDLLELARERGSKKLGFEAGRVRLYMYALCGDKRWSGLLEGDEPEDQRLRTAGEIEYPAWVLRGRTHVALLELSEMPPPSDAATGAAVAAGVHDLVTLYGGRGELEAARAELADLAQVAQYAALAGGGLDELFAGRVESLDEGRLRVTYDFVDAAQLRDFQAGRYRLDGNGFEPKADSEALRLEEDGLVIEGRGCLRSIATFEGPIRASYRYSHATDMSLFGVMLGVHDTGDANQLRAMGAMMLWWSDPDRSPPAGSAHHEVSITYRPRAECLIELSLDEEGKATLSRDGETYVELPDCPRKRGAVFLGVKGEESSKFKFSELVVEGKLTDDARERLRRLRAKRAGDELRAP